MKDCKRCGAAIIGRWKNAQYCSDTCREDARRNKYLADYHNMRRQNPHAPRACKRDGCNETFIPAHAGKLYCSPACYPSNASRKKQSGGFGSRMNQRLRMVKAFKKHGLIS